MPQELTNKKLFGLLSLESMASLLVAVFIFGTGWQVLASDIKDAKKDIAALQKQQQALVAELSDMQVSIGKISTLQKAEAEKAEDLQEDIKYIRQLLEHRR